ncbi:MAG TPA: carboxypeptidase-like regulatory domain-containing protein [Vicinamibacterales bacterium]|nr:carboxypeptidase-like regulatory domain-containing protein [Vicinamibacterales bacterium]
MPPLRITLACVLTLSSAVNGNAFQSPSEPAPSPAGVITGTVTDGGGKPVVGAKVQAAVRFKRWVGAYYEIAVGPTDDTDDRGRFRLHSLPRGQYVVVVTLQDPAGPTRRDSTGQRRTYHPGVLSLDAATPVAIEPGNELDVSIRFAPVRLFSIAGAATTSAGLPAAGFNVSLRGIPATIGYTGVPVGFMTTVIAGATTALDGSFSLVAVPPGSYTLTVTNGYARREQPLEINEVRVDVSAPVTGLKVTTARGSVVSGRLEWAGTGPSPWPGSKTFVSIRATGIGRESNFGSIDTDIQPDGTFRFTNLYGLRRIHSTVLAIQSIEAPKEAMTGPNLNITPGTDVTDVRLIVTNRTATVMATLVDETDKPLSASLVLMPRDETNLDPLGWGFRVAQSAGSTGGVPHHTMGGVLPGSYLMIGIDVGVHLLSADADLMQRARAAATPIEITPGLTQRRMQIVRLRPFVRPPLK